MVLGLLTGYGKKDNTTDTPKVEPEAKASSVKVGIIYIGDENEGYTGVHMAGITVCEAAGVPCVGYNVDMTSVAPNTALTSAAMDWGPYYTYAVKSVIDGTPIDTDWCQGLKDGAVKITPLNDKVVAKGTADKVKEVEDAIKAGTFHVFDTKTFTIGGKSIEELIKSDTNYAKYTDYVKDGYFHESELISAPSFDLRIDGIKEMTK